MKVNIINHKQKILLDCDQSNVLFARIIFLYILLTAFQFIFSHHKWRHRSRDHSTAGGRLPIGGP